MQIRLGTSAGSDESLRGRRPGAMQMQMQNIQRFQAAWRTGRWPRFISLVFGSARSGCAAILGSPPDVEAAEQAVANQSVTSR